MAQRLNKLFDAPVFILSLNQVAAASGTEASSAMKKRFGSRIIFPSERVGKSGFQFRRFFPLLLLRKISSL